MRNWEKYSRIADHKWNLINVSECDSNVDQEKRFYVGAYTSVELTETIHCHDFVQIYYIISGLLQHDVAEGMSSLSAGDIFIIPPGIWHKVAVSCGGSANFVSIGFMPEFVDFLPDNASLISTLLNNIFIDSLFEDDVQVKPRIIFGNEQQIMVNNLINDMLREYTERSEGHLTYIKGQLLQLLVLIARAYTEKLNYTDVQNKVQNYRGTMLECIDYVNKNYAKNMKLDDIAHQFLLSRSYFCALFKRYTGKSFNEYVTDVRIGHAKELLRYTSSSITEIAYECGFNNITTFNRTFYKRIGLSPSTYRKTQ